MPVGHQIRCTWETPLHLPAPQLCCAQHAAAHMKAGCPHPAISSSLVPSSVLEYCSSRNKWDGKAVDTMIGSGQAVSGIKSAAAWQLRNEQTLLGCSSQACSSSPGEAAQRGPGPIPCPGNSARVRHRCCCCRRCSSLESCKQVSIGISSHIAIRCARKRASWYNSWCCDVLLQSAVDLHAIPASELRQATRQQQAPHSQCRAMCPCRDGQTRVVAVAGVHTQRLLIVAPACQVSAK